MSLGDLCLVLVEPEQGVNVGFVARTMACYGITDLRIVGEGRFSQDVGAQKTAKGASQIMDSIQYYPNLSAAIAECHFSFGFTRRERESAQKMSNLHNAVKEWQGTISSGKKSSEIKTALIFGRESQGLSREETLLLSHLVRIDLPHETISLNVSHAVAIALYAFSENGKESLQRWSPEQAAVERDGLLKPVHAEQLQVLKVLCDALESKGFFRSGKESAQRDYVRMLWQRLQPTQMELDFLAGLIKRLSATS